MEVKTSTLSCIALLDLHGHGSCPDGWPRPNDVRGVLSPPTDKLPDVVGQNDLQVRITSSSFIASRSLR